MNRRLFITTILSLISLPSLNDNIVDDDKLHGLLYHDYSHEYCGTWLGIDRTSIPEIKSYRTESSNNLFFDMDKIKDIKLRDDLIWDSLTRD